MAELPGVDWDVIGDRICEIVAMCLENRQTFEKEGKKRGIVIESLVAAAITGYIQKQLEIPTKLI